MAEKYGLQVAAGEAGLDREVRAGYCGDLLSDVMANAPEGCVWLTIMGHQNTIAVAHLRDMAAIVVTGGHEPDENTRARAEQEKVPLLTTEKFTYELAGILYADGVAGEAL